MRVAQLALLGSLFLTTSAYAFDPLEWIQAHPRLAAIGKESLIGLAGGYAQGIAEGKEGNDLARATGASGLNNLVQETLRQGIDQVRQVSAPRTQVAIDRLKSGIDSKTSLEEYNMMLAAINLRMAEYEAETRDQEYRLAEAEARTRENSQSIQDLKSDSRYQQQQLDQLRRNQEADRKAFEEAIDRIDLDLAKIRNRQAQLEDDLLNEVVERKQEDAYLYRQLDIHSEKIREIMDYYAPRTAGETATQLAANGAMLLLKNGDPVDAARTLQLAMAYDKRSRKHVDPGMRYYLAVAYRRMGKEVQADEMLSEALVAERFRRTDMWYARLREKFHGEDRQWIEERRQEARFGVRAPRQIIHVETTN